MAPKISDLDSGASAGTSVDISYKKLGAQPVLFHRPVMLLPRLLCQARREMYPRWEKAASMRMLCPPASVVR